MLGMDSPGVAADRRRAALVPLVVALYAAAVTLPFLGSARVLSQHEGFIATTALRMLAGDSWLIPQYGNWNRIEKPPAYNWICAGLFGLVGGMSETAERLPAALSAIGLCVVVAIVARRFFDDRTALLAGLIQASCVWLYIQGRLGENDTPLTFLLTIAHAALLWNWGRGNDRLPLAAALVFHTAVGLAVMFKGAAALPYPALTLFAWCLVRRSIRPLVSVVATPAVLCFVAGAAPWHAYVWWQLGDEALQRWGYNAVGRVTGEHHLGGEPFWFYFAHIPWLMLPWSIALLVNARVLAREAWKPDAYPQRFLWTWFLAGLLFLSIASFKHKHYCFPILPPLAILCAPLVSRHIEALGRLGRSGYATVFAAAVLAYGLVSGVVQPRLDHWAETMRFVRETTRQIPLEAKLYAVGLGNSPVYPYIARPYEYLDGLPSLAEAMRARSEQESWIVVLRQDLLREPAVALDPEIPESRRKDHPDAQRLVIGRVAPAD
jgi:4-amino-4-deoxy-L-arabinose transferase-like glycosyltransferase